jgi:hypothetical protein
LLECDGNVIPGSLASHNGPPSSYMVAPSSADPASSLLNQFFGGLNLNETMFTNRLAIVYAGPIASTIGENSTCSLVFSDLGDYQLTGSTKMMADEYVEFTFNESSCDYNDVLALKNLGDKVIEYGKNIQNIHQAKSLNQLISALKSREVYAGCKNLIKDWLNFKEGIKKIEGSKSCLYRYEDPQWQHDPCCNPRLRVSQCCIASDYEIATTIIDSVNYEMIAGMCTNPGKVGALVSGMVDAAKNENLEDFDLEEEYQELYKPMETCQRAVFQTSCSEDSDCLYTGKCSNWGQCQVDWMNPGPALVKCFISTLSKDMLLEFQTVLQIPTAYESIEEAISQTTNKVLAMASSEDCAGPQSWEYKRRTEWRLDENGNYFGYQVPGDKVGCLSVKQCRY